MTYNVTKVRKEAVTKNGESHEHIVGVLTDDGTYHKNQEVVNSLNLGNTWQTSVSAEPKAKIKPLNYCPAVACLHNPYLTTAPDHSKKNNLENLPRG